MTILWLDFETRSRCDLPAKGVYNYAQDASTDVLCMSYKVRVDRPTSGGVPYVAECNDIIEALAMEYDVANAFKAAWRVAALRQGRGKPGQDSPVYDGEKIVFFGQRIIERAKL